MDDLQKDIITAKICGYCLTPTEMHPMGEFYNNDMANYAGKFIYHCPNCLAYVGTHKDSTEALGRVASPALRTLRIQAHAVFDPIWKELMNRGYTKVEARTGAYIWLSRYMGTLVEETHIGYFTEQQCIDAIYYCEKYNPFQVPIF